MQLRNHLRQGELLYFHHGSDKLSISENQYFRWLAFDQVIQSIMHKRLTWSLTLPHQSAMLLPLLFFRPLTVVEFGLGGGNLSRYLKHVNGNINVISIEKNPIIIECFQQYFNPEQHTIALFQDSAQSWLRNTNTTKIDWLLCDIYQQQVNSQISINFLAALMRYLTPNTCLSINLPDASASEINCLLTMLQYNLLSHKLVYFQVPYYNNIIMHIYPSYWLIDTQLKRPNQSYLPKRTFHHWRKIWQHAKQITKLPSLNS